MDKSNVLLMEMEIALSKLRLLQERPSIRLQPNLRLDGNQWCTYLGESSDDGVIGYGDTPETAMLDFDRAWLRWPGTAGVLQKCSVENSLRKFSNGDAAWTCPASAIGIYRWLEHKNFNIRKPRTIQLSGGPACASYTGVRGEEKVSINLFPDGAFEISGEFGVVSSLRKEFLECFNI